MILIEGEERCFDAVMEEIMSRPSKSCMPVHVINVEIRDTNEDSLIGAQFILQLVALISKLEDVDNMIEDTIESFVRETECDIRYCVAFN